VYGSLKNISYPFANLESQNLPAEVLLAVRRCLVDFKLQVHLTFDLLTNPVAYVTQLGALNGNLRLGLRIEDPNLISGQLATTLSGSLELVPQAPSSEDLVKYHFDTSDFTAIDPGAVLPDVHVEGMISTNALSELVLALSSFSPFLFSGLMLEPATVSLFCRHKVNGIRCRTAKPLLLQTASDRYFPETDEVVGDVKLVAGDNCVIAVQEVSNTIVISPRREANDSQSERCGPWAEPVSPKDVLCGDIIYGISGAVPDSEGNIQVKADSPLYVGTLSRQELLENTPEFGGPLAEVPAEVEWVIYVGLPAGPNNASVFDCEGV